MTYATINGTQMGQNLTYAFVYANSVTSEMFGLFTLIFFFITVLLISLFMQFRFTTRVKFELSLLASSFVSVALGIILLQANILQFHYWLIFAGIFVLSIIWVVFSRE